MKYSELKDGERYKFQCVTDLIINGAKNARYGMMANGQEDTSVVILSMSTKENQNSLTATVSSQYVEIKRCNSHGITDCFTIQLDGRTPNYFGRAQDKAKVILRQEEIKNLEAIFKASGIDDHISTEEDLK